MYKLYLEETENQRSNFQYVGSQKKQGNYIHYFKDHTKAFDCVDHNKLWNILDEREISDHLTCLLRNMYAGQEATEPFMEQWTGSELGKEYVKSVYGHPAHLTAMQSTS